MILRLSTKLATKLRIKLSKLFPLDANPYKEGIKDGGMFRTFKISLLVPQVTNKQALKGRPNRLVLEKIQSVSAQKPDTCWTHIEHLKSKTF